MGLAKSGRIDGVNTDDMMANTAEYLREVPSRSIQKMCGEWAKNPQFGKRKFSLCWLNLGAFSIKVLSHLHDAKLTIIPTTSTPAKPRQL